MGYVIWVLKSASKMVSSSRSIYSIGRAKMAAGSEFQFLGVIGINDLSKALVRFLSNLTEKE